MDGIGLEMVFPKRDYEVGNPKHIKFCKANISQVEF
jgi:hypothetical protein